MSKAPSKKRLSEQCWKHRNYWDRQDLSKQWRIWSGSTLFATHPIIFRHINRTPNLLRTIKKGQSLLVSDKKIFKGFSLYKDGGHGGHLGFPIGTILSIFDLQVTLMLSTKFKVKKPFNSGEEAKNRFSRWPHHGFMIRKILAIFDL